jgi:hypothetical protein
MSYSLGAILVEGVLSEQEIDNIAQLTWFRFFTGGNFMATTPTSSMANFIGWGQPSIGSNGYYTFSGFYAGAADISSSGSKTPSGAGFLLLDWATTPSPRVSDGLMVLSAGRYFDRNTGALFASTYEPRLFNLSPDYNNIGIGSSSSNSAFNITISNSTAYITFEAG